MVLKDYENCTRGFKSALFVTANSESRKASMAEDRGIHTRATHRTEYHVAARRTSTSFSGNGP